jgi:hypothetical protein
MGQMENGIPQQSCLAIGSNVTNSEKSLYKVYPDIPADWMARKPDI